MEEKVKHFVGLDVSIKETAICIMDDAGQRVWEGSVPSSADAIAAIILEKASDLISAGIETGPQAVWLWHALRDRGIAADCIHARRAAALKLQANKKDRNDAFGLARLVHSGWYEPVAIKSFDRCRMRGVLTERERIVRMCTMMINQIRGLAKTFGLQLSASKGEVFEQSVHRALPDDAVLRNQFEGPLSVLSGLKGQRRHLIGNLHASHDKTRPAGSSQVPRCRQSYGDRLSDGSGRPNSVPVSLRRRCLSWADAQALSVGRSRHWRADLKDRRSLDPQDSVRGGHSDPVSRVTIHCVEAVGFETECAIREVEGPRRHGAQAGHHASDHVENQHDVREQELRHIILRQPNVKHVPGLAKVISRRALLHAARLAMTA
ncbi:IS110 family transposase [Loktanella atrilutea]|uniref:IS110 family transposase n=1 Tax=Loktanella atrilutea TaxID=366533 RepID=UPI003CCC367F